MKRTRKPKMERFTDRPGFVRDIALSFTWRRVPKWREVSGPVFTAEGAWRCYFRPLERRVREAVWVLYVGGENVPIARELLHAGTMTNCQLSSAEILRSALYVGASGFIVAHNHPMGPLKPSPTDELAFKELTDAAALLDMTLLDSLIVAPGNCWSMRDQAYTLNSAARRAERPANQKNETREAADSLLLECLLRAGVHVKGADGTVQVAQARRGGGMCDRKKSATGAG